MSMFNDAFGQIKKNREDRESGKIISIPFPFKRFSKYSPGIEKGRYIITTAGAKVGKTKFTDFLFLYNVIQAVKKFGIKVKIFYFSLEMAKQDKILEMMSHFLYEKYKIVLSTDLLSSAYEHYITQKAILDILENEIKADIEEAEKYVEFIDNIRNPYGIYKHVRDYAEKNGRYFTKDKKHIPLSDIYNKDKKLAEKASKAIDHYKADDPDEYVLVITDHLSLLTPEKGEDLRAAMGNYSSNYCIKMRNRWNYTPISVQQQAAAQEGVDNVKAAMIRPTANGLADNKTTGRDVDLLLGLFSPARMQQKYWEGYNIGMSDTEAGRKSTHPYALLGNYRELSICYSRRGYSDVYGHLFFNGASNVFKELPKPNDFLNMDQVEKLSEICRKAGQDPKEHVNNILHAR